MSMSRKALILMAITLAAATAATAATALAGTSSKQRNIGQEVADSVRNHANAVQHVKVKNLRLVQARDTIKFTVALPRR